MRPNFFYGLAILLLPISAFLSSTEWILGRNAAFLSLMILVLLFVFNREKCRYVNRSWLILSLSVGVMALGQYWWVNQYGNPLDQQLLANKNYATTCKLLAALGLLVFMTSVIPRTVIYRYRFALLAMIMLAYGIAAVQAFYIYFTEQSTRANIGGISTTAAYIATFQGLVCIYALYRVPLRYQHLLIFLVILISFTIIVMTGTRSAVLLFPLVIILLATKNMSKRELTKYLPLISIVVIIPLVISGQIRERFVEAYHDIKYQSVNNSTSIGSRWSMWQAGLVTAYNHPLGQDAISRNNAITQYIISNQKGNSEALRNIPYHLHNEVIEVASLQGILPAIFILIFYLCTVLALAHKVDSIYTFTLPLIGFGLFDVLFIYPKALLCLFSILCLYSLLNRLEKGVTEGL